VGNQKLIMYNGGHNGAGSPIPYIDGSTTG
jgi:hypothetical protein